MQNLPIGEVVSTKLQAPPPPQSMLSRSRLNRALDDGLARGVTIVTAPAGFGKTVAVADWASRHDNAERIAWLSLTRSDNEPHRFWVHIVEAIRSIELAALAETRRDLERGKTPIGESFAAQLINELVVIEDPVIVVVDNFEHISHREVMTWLAFVLQVLPPTIRFVLCTRGESDLPLGRWRAAGRLSEVGADALRLTDDEAEAYLDPLIAGELNADQMQVLLGKADGWIAGLYLAALGILRAPDPAAFVEGFGARGDTAGDYLVGEVLVGLPDAMRSFLLTSSILREISPAACDALMDRTDSALMLSALDKHGILLTAGFQERTWEYHPLFREVLLSILDKEVGPGGLVELHRKAGRWYQQEGHYADAVDHAIQAEEYDMAREILENEGIDLLRAEPDRMHDLMVALPDDLVEGWPLTRAFRIWTAGVRVDIATLERLLGLEALSTNDSMEPMVREILSYLRGDLDRMGSEAPGAHPRVLAVTRGLAASVTEHYREGADVLRECIADESGTVFSAISATSILAWNQVAAGKLHTGVAFASRALEVADASRIRWFHGARWAELARAQVEFDRGQLDEAYRHIVPITEAVDLDALAYVEGRILASKITWARGERSVASRHLAEAVQAPTGPVAGVAARRIAMAQAHLCLLDRDLDMAEAWLPDWRTRVDSGAADERERLLLARFLIDTGDPERARTLLAERAHDGDSSVRYVIEAKKLQAIAAWEADDPAAPMLLEVALAMAEAEGFVQTFVDDAGSLGAIGRSGDRGVLAAVGTVQGSLAGERVSTASRPNRSARGHLVEPLTDREISVLRYLPTRLSNQEIAREMFVSINTVKSHVKAIYRKLGVSSRNEAVRRAVELRLV